jgi:hypothetical protein
VLERDLIQSNGFCNVIEDGKKVGFQFQLRMPSYRGLAASLIDGVGVVIDGKHSFEPQEPLWILQGKKYTLAELHASEGVRWQLEDAAIVEVRHEGGLESGIHDLAVDLRLRMSYVPIEHQPSRYLVSRKVTIIK